MLYTFALFGFGMTAVYFGIKWGLTKNNGLIDRQQEIFLDCQNPSQKYDWQMTEEWPAIKEAMAKDKDIILRAASEADIDARVLASVIAIEQLRLFFSDRAIFEKIFNPLKILGVQNNMSWGVVGIKEKTAETVENNLKDTSSPFYPGDKYSHMLDFKTEDINKERYEKITDPHNRFYSYLYASLLFREVQTQWTKAGFPIDKNPGVLATLFNIGFNNSNPKPDPQIGGAEIDMNGKMESFGGLALEFYRSDELINEFPKQDIACIQ